jgi:hypothetical protein
MPDWSTNPGEWSLSPTAAPRRDYHQPSDVEDTIFFLSCLRLEMDIFVERKRAQGRKGPRITAGNKIPAQPAREARTVPQPASWNSLGELDKDPAIQEYCRQHAGAIHQLPPVKYEYIIEQALKCMKDLPSTRPGGFLGAPILEMIPGLYRKLLRLNIGAEPLFYQLGLHYSVLGRYVCKVMGDCAQRQTSNLVLAMGTFEEVDYTRAKLYETQVAQYD